MLLISGTVLATSEKTFLLYDDAVLKKSERFFTTPGGERFSDTKACRAAKCEAVKTLTSSRTLAKQKIDIGPGGSNPASLLCVKLGGKEETLYLASKDEVSVCVFGDGSKVDSWDLYRAHFGKPRE